MDYSSASSYVYAKACGILGKSYIGSNAQKLFEAKSLSELWEMIFHTSAPATPEVMLANHLEYEAVRKFIREYTTLLSYYDKPHSFIVDLLTELEVRNLKTLSASLCWGEEICPRYFHLGKYQILHVEKWPDLELITADTPFSWYNKIPDSNQRWEMDYKLDLQEFRRMWHHVNKINDSASLPLKEFIQKDFSKRNMLWALRLKIYYKMTKENIISHLFYAGEEPSASDILCSEAMDILDREPDNYEQWQTWKYSEYLNPYESGSIWNVNPAWIEQKFRLEETRNAKKLFHQYPMTDICMVMFFKLKQQELNCIRAAVEALRLHADKNEAMYAAGITAEIH